MQQEDIQGLTTFFDTEYVDDCDFMTNIHHLLDVLLPGYFHYFHPYQLIINKKQKNFVPTKVFKYQYKSLVQAFNHH